MKKTMLFLLLAFCFSNSVQAGQDAVSIKLISFNMRTSWGRDGDNSWPNRRHATAQMLRQEAPDVMGVQEAMQDQLYYIDTECPRYARVGEDRDGGAEGGETMAVFYLRGNIQWFRIGSGHDYSRSSFLPRQDEMSKVRHPRRRLRGALHFGSLSDSNGFYALKATRPIRRTGLVVPSGI